MKCLSDLVLQGLISSAFWLTIFLIGALVFRRELRGLLRSLTALKIAGASFVLSDRRSTIESYAMLANILVDILSQREAAPKVRQLMSRSNGEELAKFLVKYEQDVPEEERNLEFLKNVARIVGWTGHHEVAIKFFDRLLKKHPKNDDLLLLRANQLNDTGLTDNLKEARAEFEKLLTMRSNTPWVNHRYAINLARLGEYEACIDQLMKIEPPDYWREHPDVLDDRHLAPVFHGAKQERVTAFRKRVADALASARPAGAQT